MLSITISWQSIQLNTGIKINFELSIYPNYQLSKTIPDNGPWYHHSQLDGIV